MVSDAVEKAVSGIGSKFFGNFNVITKKLFECRHLYRAQARASRYKCASEKFVFGSVVDFWFLPKIFQILLSEKQEVPMWKVMTVQRFKEKLKKILGVIPWRILSCLSTKT